MRKCIFCDQPIPDHFFFLHGISSSAMHIATATAIFLSKTNLCKAISFRCQNGYRIWVAITRLVVDLVRFNLHCTRPRLEIYFQENLTVEGSLRNHPIDRITWHEQRNWFSLPLEFAQCAFQVSVLRRKHNLLSDYHFSVIHIPHILCDVVYFWFFKLSLRRVFIPSIISINKKRYMLN